MWKPAGIAAPEWHRQIDYLLFLLFAHLEEHANESIPPKKVECPNVEPGRVFLLRNYVEVSSPVRGWRPTLPLLHATPQGQRFVRYDIFSVRSYFYGLDLTVRAALHFEYWTITFICSLDRSDRDRLPKEANLVLNMCNTVEGLGNFIKNHLPKHWKGKPISPTSKENELLRRVRGDLVTGFRELIETRLIQLCKTYQADNNFVFDNVGNVFAEFYGTVLGVEVIEFDGDKTNDGATRPDGQAPMDVRVECAGIGENLPGLPIHAQVGTSDYSSKAAIHLIDTVWPVIEALHRDDPLEKRSGAPEYTISTFQKARALYISSLGRLNPDARSSIYEPVIYTLIVSYRSRWQLGRMIERINTLGTLRLAAVRDIELLSHANGDIRGIEYDLNAAKQAGSKLDSSAYAGRHLSVGSNIENGLMYRIERSRYYVQEYREQLGQLRARRIEGFQPYEAFVRRRLFTTFDYIDRIGIRFRDLRDEIELLLQKARTERLIQLESSIKTVSEGINRRHVKTNVLLDNAEYLIAAPLAYYFGVIIHSVAELSYPGLIPQGVAFLVSLIFAAAVLLLLKKMARWKEKYHLTAEEPHGL